MATKIAMDTFNTLVDNILNQKFIKRSDYKSKQYVFKPCTTAQTNESLMVKTRGGLDFFWTVYMYER